LTKTKTGAAVERKYSGVGQAFVKIWKEEGFVGYFKGNLTNVIRIIPINAIQFLSYEKYKNFISNLETKPGEPRRLSTVGRLTAGALAGMTSTLCTYPLDLIRCRLSAQHEVRKYTGIINAGVVIFKEEGFIGLYRGLFPSLLGIAPYVGINFTSYEILKRETLRWQNKDELGVISKLVLGGLAGTISQTITYPLETIRRRMQMQSMGTKTATDTGLIKTTVNIYKKYGWTGYFKGLVPNLLKVIPVVAVNFIVYEYMKKLLGLARAAKEI